MDITIDQFIRIVDSYIRWYDEKRIKISLGSLNPIEYWDPNQSKKSWLIDT
jgi:hypothetical protein